MHQNTACATMRKGYIVAEGMQKLRPLRIEKRIATKKSIIFNDRQKLGQHGRNQTLFHSETV
jgi:hypothetical protein